LAGFCSIRQASSAYSDPQIHLAGFKLVIRRAVKNVEVRQDRGKIKNRATGKVKGEGETVPL